MAVHSRETSLHHLVSNRRARDGRRMPGSTHGPRAVLGVLVIGLVVVTGLSAVLVGSSAAARAAGCDQGANRITGNWTITTTQVCSGMLYTVDGSVIIDAGGSLTLIDGGLSFAKDAAHTGYGLSVNAGGELILDRSQVTVQIQAIEPYLKLALAVSGANSRFTMRNGSALEFPGWFNATDATINITDSSIRGLPNTELARSGLWTDDNNDSAVISWASTNATLYNAQISNLYENWSYVLNGGNATGLREGNLSLTAGSTLRAYDSYIGVDFSNLPGIHNELQVDATSSAFLYGVTFDRSQDPSWATNWMPAIVPEVGGRVDLLRWLRATVVDATGYPVTGAAIWTTLSPGLTTAEYPDNGNRTTPNSQTLSFLGRDATGPNAWNVTDANGQAVIPLFTDAITSASLPNAYSFGNYRLSASFAGSAAAGSVTFHPYPAVSAADNEATVTVLMSGVQVPALPDLALDPADYATPVTAIQNQAFPVNARIYNLGRTPATNVSIAAFLDGNRSTQAARLDGITVATFVNETLNVTGIATLGTHSLMLVVDPNNTIPEGGAAREANNFANLTVQVTAPPKGYVTIQAPLPGVTVIPGASLSVTGFVRGDGFVGLGGVPLTVNLYSGSTRVATSASRSGSDGFFLATLQVPANATDGPYTIVVTPASGLIQPDSRPIAIQRPTSALSQLVPLLGIPWWLFLAILAAVAVIVIVVTLYFKIYGLGKMVECGECGAFIPEDATVCPKCGVEFEKDMAKCSNCQAWIPVDVKQCPECGVEFATGELDAADYGTMMRLQYEEVVEKLRADAQRQLHRSVSPEEFEKWWRLQPSFVTFEDWLHREEATRRTGSRACPGCGTLNSLSAKVCHVCGTRMAGKLPKAPGQDTAAPGVPRTEGPEAPAGRSMIKGTDEPDETPSPEPKKVAQRTLPEDEESGDGR